MVVRVPADPSRHRVAVWRELRRAGAVSLGQGVWVVPDAPVFADGIARTVELAERGDGEVTVLTAVGRAEADVARLEALFGAERAEEWAEFIAECTKRIVHQRDVIASAFQKGHATDVPVSMLRALEASLRAFEGHRLLIVDRQKGTERR